MKDIIKTLRTIFWIDIVLSLLIFGVVEFVLLDLTGGMLVGHVQLEFLWQSFSILLTLGGIYGALRMFKLKSIEARIVAYPSICYPTWSIWRLVVLTFVLDNNIMSYWLFANGSFAWLATIVLLTFPFIYPTEERFLYETKSKETV